MSNLKTEKRINPKTINLIKKIMLIVLTLIMLVITFFIGKQGVNLFFNPTAEEIKFGGMYIIYIQTISLFYISKDLIKNWKEIN